MLNTFRQLRHCFIFLVIVALSLGIGGRESLCIMPDGGVHLEQNHSTCVPAAMNCEERTEPQALLSGNFESRAQCLDIALGDDASSHHYRCLAPVPAVGAIPQGPPLLLASTAQTTPSIIPAAPPQQLLSLRSIVLLI